MSRRLPASARLAWIPLAALALAAGCGPTGPETHPVQGKIVFKEKGGNLRQLAGGKVFFQSTSDPSLTAVGEIDDSGAFTMGITLKEKNYAGVPAGQYKARVEPPPDDDEGKPRRGLFNAKYQDFDKSKLSFTVPVSDPIVIELGR